MICNSERTTLASPGSRGFWGLGAWMTRMRDGACPIDDRPASWSDIFLTHRVELLAFLRRRASGIRQANDLLHDLFVKVTGRGLARPDGDARAYLFRAAANVAIDAARAERHRRGEPHDAAWETADPAPDALQVLMARDALRRLDEALAELPEETRAMVHLIRIDGLGHEEVARMFGVSKSTVEKRLATALRHCRARMRPEADPSE